MRQRTILTAILSLANCLSALGPATRGQGQELYVVPDDAETRWCSFENPRAEKGKGGAENQTAKGHAFEMVPPGHSRTLLDAKGAGIVQRIWITISERSPAALRSARVEMYWDDAAEPAVNVPIVRFFWFRIGQAAPSTKRSLQRSRGPLVYFVHSYALPQSRAHRFYQRQRREHAAFLRCGFSAH
jgi:hypothetical protein